MGKIIKSSNLMGKFALGGNIIYIIYLSNTDDLTLFGSSTGVAEQY